MSDLDPALSALIEEERRGYAEPSPAPDAGWSRVRSHFETSTPPPPSPRGGAKVLWLFGGATILALAAVSLLVPRDDRAPHARTPRVAAPPVEARTEEATSPGSDARALPAREQAPPVRELEPAEPRVVERHEPRAAQAPVAVPSVPVPAAPEVSAPPPPEEADTLALEMALLGRARMALNAHDPSGALALTEEHARLYPDGVLAPERRALARRARCAALAESDRSAATAEGCP